MVLLSRSIGDDGDILKKFFLAFDMNFHRGIHDIFPMNGDQNLDVFWQIVRVKPKTDHSGTNGDVPMLFQGMEGKPSIIYGRTIHGIFNRDDNF